MPSFPVHGPDARLHLAKRRNYPAVHELPPTPSPAEALEVIGRDKPDVCTLHCWRHGGTTTCICGEEEGDEGTTEGGW